MRLPDPVAPYASLLKWGLIAGVLAAAAWFGYSRGVERQVKRGAEQVRTLQATIDRKSEALRKAGDALGDAARTFRQIDAETDLALKRASEWREAANLADQRAADARKTFTARIAKMAADAEQEKKTCSQAEMFICGVPLQ